MSQKSLIAITFCVTAILIIWMLHGSLCEIRMRFWGAEFAAFLQCKQQGNRDGGVIPRQSVAKVG
ncbi:Hok/Gef family protein [Escherichia coli]|nr:Hok/Gef family protein [Escherichia coli]